MTTREAQRLPGFNLTTADEICSQPSAKVLIYGPSKSGKTHLARTTGCPGQTLVVATEPHLSTLVGSGVAIVQVDTIPKLTKLCDALKRPGHGFLWVIIDGITEVADACLEAEQAGTQHGKKAYGGMALKMKPVMRRLRDIPCHVVMTAWQDDVEHRDGKGDNARVWYTHRPLLPGNVLKQAAPYLFDVVCALRVFRPRPNGDAPAPLERRLQTGEDQGYEAGHRYGNALELYEPPDLALLERKILGDTNQPRRDDATQTRTQ